MLLNKYKSHWQNILNFRREAYNTYMQFQMPQFIEVEDKIFGPLTLRQFVYIVGGAGACIGLWVLMPFKILAIIFIIPVFAFSFALAFYKVNNKPFIDLVESAFYYFFGGKLYIWKKEDRKPEARNMQKNNVGIVVPKISESKLKDLSWSLDIRESLNPVTRDQK